MAASVSAVWRNWTSRRYVETSISRWARAGKRTRHGIVRGVSNRQWRKISRIMVWRQAWRRAAWHIRLPLNVLRGGKAHGGGVASHESYGAQRGSLKRELSKYRKLHFKPAGRRRRRTGESEGRQQLGGFISQHGGIQQQYQRQRRHRALFTICPPARPTSAAGENENMWHGERRKCKIAKTAWRQQ